MATQYLGLAGTPEADAADLIGHTVEEVVRLDARSRIGMSASDRLADLATNFSGSMVFVLVHALWFGTWIAVNLLPGISHFDGFPFGLLTLIVSLEAIFLSTFVLISQNRQALAADRRAKVDLQVNVIAEHEVTKLIQLVTEMHDHLGIARDHDPELKQMQSRTYISDLANAVDDAENGADPQAADGPDSAADTEA